MTLVYWILCPVAVQVLLAGNRLEKRLILISRGDEVAAIRHSQSVFRVVSVQSFRWPDLLQLWRLHAVGIAAAIVT